MVYKRGKRPSLYFDGRTRHGFQQLCTNTPDKVLAQRMEHMWSVLAERHRAWDLLEPVLADLPKRTAARVHTIGTLYDAWEETRHNVEAMRRLAADINIEPLVVDWFAVYVTQVQPDSAQHALAHVRALLPEHVARMASRITADVLTTALAAYDGKRNTQRKVHSSWTQFFAYATRIKRAFATNPMDQVERPAPEDSPVRFYELDVVERIVAWQPTEQRRALMALYYGSSVDVTPGTQLVRSDFNPATKEFRGVGTKTRTRDRMLRVADWAWPIVWGYIKHMTPATPLFPGLTRWGANFWHRQTVTLGLRDTAGRIVTPALNLTPAYPLQCARDHWAVRAVRSGAPLQMIAAQLGHSSPQLTLKKYGRFLPSASDRAKWEQVATEYERERRGSLG